MSIIQLLHNQKIYTTIDVRLQTILINILSNKENILRYLKLPPKLMDQNTL